MLTRVSLAAAAVLVTAVTLAGCGSSTVDVADTGHHISDIRPAKPKSASVSSASRAAAGAGRRAHSAHHDAGDPAHAKLKNYAAFLQRGVRKTYGRAFAHTFAAIRVAPVYPSGLKFVYVYQNFVDVPSAVRRLRTTVPVLQASFTSEMEPEMKRMGFSDHPSVTWAYLNPDGSPIWSYTAS